MLKVPTGCLAHRYVYVIITRCTCLAWSKFRIAAIKSFILYVMLCYLTSFGYLRLLDAAVYTVRLNFGFQSDWCWIHCTYLGNVRVTECIVTRWSTRLTWSACTECVFIWHEVLRGITTSPEGILVYVRGTLRSMLLVLTYTLSW